MAINPQHEAALNVVEISADYHVAFPRSECERLRRKPGQMVQVLVLCERIELIPLRAARHRRGLARGIDARVERDAH